MLLTGTVGESSLDTFFGGGALTEVRGEGDVWSRVKGLGRAMMYTRMDK